MAASKRIHRKTDRKPEELARIRAIRDRFQKERPSPDDLVESGECSPLVPHWLYVAAQRLLADLRAERKRRNVTLNDLATRTGIAKSTLSLLENGKKDNPTVATLVRYAHALGKRVRFVLEDEDNLADRRSEQITA